MLKPHAFVKLPGESSEAIDTAGRPAESAFLRWSFPAYTADLLSQLAAFA